MTATVAEKLLKIRREKGFSQSDLAKRAGISPAQISQYERGYSQIGVRNLTKIAGALGCEIGELDSRISNAVMKNDDNAKYHRYVVDKVLLQIIDVWQELSPDAIMAICGIITDDRRQCAERKESLQKKRRLSA